MDGDASRGQEEQAHPPGQDDLKNVPQRCVGLGALPLCLLGLLGLLGLWTLFCFRAPFLGVDLLNTHPHTTNLLFVFAGDSVIVVVSAESRAK